MPTHICPGRIAALLVLGSSLLAFEPDEVRIRVSVKRVLGPQGELPGGKYGSEDEIERVIGKCNAALAASGAAWTLVLTEIADAPGAAAFHSMSAGELADLEAQAKANPAAFAWRSNAVNIYVVDELTDAGGVCSFPTIGPHREAIAINSRSILGGSEGWLHEIGHYFNLIHTHEGDGVADTIPDPALPDPFDCGAHDQRFLASAAQLGAGERDTFNGLHNIMGYHCDPLVLTPLQIVRMRRALLDYRGHVLEPAPPDQPPVATIDLPREAGDGKLPLVHGSALLEVGGWRSHDGDGGSDLTCRWAVVGGLAGGARFESPAQGWLRGCSGFGYGDDDDLTELADMQGGYLTVYLTRRFEVPELSQIAALELDIAYDDGFAAYLNGVEVARRNLTESAGVDTPATQAGDQREVIDLTAFKDRLRQGSNRLSIEVHNARLDSSDFSAHPVLYARTTAGEEQALIPSRAVWYYARGSAGEPPVDWKEVDFDAGARGARLRFTLPGTYTVRLTVDDGQPPGHTAVAEASVTVEAGLFLRGDCNGDLAVDIADPVRGLNFLFLGVAAAPCLDACDANDDGAVNITDPIGVLGYLFLGGPEPAAPFPAVGPDGTEDGLGCSD
jgi:hypothetical protein